MTLIGFVIFGGLISLLGFSVGRLVEFRKSQREIDVLSQVIKENIQEREVKP